MSQIAVISRVLIVPGLPAPADKSLQNVNFQSISIGLAVDDAYVVWGEYHPDSGSADPLAALQEKIVPVLEGRPLAAFREIMDVLDGLTETAVLTHPVRSSPSGSVSRRGFLTGNLTAEPAVEYEEVVVERPLSPALRYCVSQILLTAQAQAQQKSAAECIAAAYNPDHSWQPAFIPLHLEIDAAAATPDAAILSSHIASLGYKISAHNPQSQLGTNGERLQRFIRQLTTLIERVTAPDYRPTIHLNVTGGLGQLFDQNIGRILGAVYGLEQAAKPYPLRITDPALLENSAQQIKFNRQLIDYIRMRGMKTEIAVSDPIQSLADVAQFIEVGAAHLIELVPSRLGTVQQSIQAIQICRQAQIGVLLCQTTDPFASQLALAVQPDLIMAFWEPNSQNIAKIYNEMARTIAWHKQNNA